MKGLFDDIEEEKPSGPEKKKRKGKEEKTEIPEGEVERELGFPLNTQKRIIEIINNSIEKGVLPHSIMLTGDVGSGKWEVVSEVAKAILCERNTTIPSCDICSSCVKAMHGNHPDITQIYHDERYIKIDEVREVRKQVRLKPYESDRRLLLIKDADRMRHEPQNALLKTLEEPPPSLVIILTTSRPHLLLDTIHSRVMRLDMAPPDAPQTVEHFVENYDVSGEYAQRLYDYFQGSIRMMVDFLETCESEEEGVEFLNSGIDVEVVELGELADKRGADRTQILSLLDRLLLRLRSLRGDMGYERYEGLTMEVLTAKERISANVNIRGTLTYLMEMLKAGN